jgi:hypothetical protein
MTGGPIFYSKSRVAAVESQKCRVCSHCGFWCSRLNTSGLQQRRTRVFQFHLDSVRLWVTGKQLPSPEQIFKLLQRPNWSLDSLHPKMLSIFNAPLTEWIPDNHEGIKIGNLLLLPLLARIHSMNINCWQYWRRMNPLVFPSEPLARVGSAAMHTRSWSLEDEGRSVFSGFSWINGPMRRLKF